MTKAALAAVEEQLQSAKAVIAAQRELVTNLAGDSYDLGRTSKRLDDLVKLAAMLEVHQSQTQAHLKTVSR